MNPIDFVKTIYLGDRGCKAVIVDSWDDIVKLKIDCISRARSPAGWNYYNDENLDDGYIVFSDVKQLNWSSDGQLPNDYIHSLEVKLSEVTDYYEFKFLVNGVFQSSVPSKEDWGEVALTIIAKNIHLESSEGEEIFN